MPAWERGRKNRAAEGIADHRNGCEPRPNRAAVDFVLGEVPLVWYTLASADARRCSHTQGGTCARKTRTSLPWATVLNRVAVLVT